MINRIRNRLADVFEAWAKKLRVPTNVTPEGGGGPGEEQ